MKSLRHFSYRDRKTLSLKFRICVNKRANKLIMELYFVQCRCLVFQLRTKAIKFQVQLYFVNRRALWMHL